MPTTTTPGNRTRVNFTQSAKGEWRIAEITIEVTDHDDPAGETISLFDDVRDSAQAEVNTLNSPSTASNPFK